VTEDDTLWRYFTQRTSTHRGLARATTHYHAISHTFTHYDTAQEWSNRLWPNTRVVKRKYYVSQKQNGFNNKIHWYSILLTFIFKFAARILWTEI